MKASFTPMSLPGGPPEKSHAFTPLTPQQFSPPPPPSQPAPEAVTPPPAPSAPPPPAEPTVELVRDGEKITHIKIVCRCGEVIELACAY